MKPLAVSDRNHSSSGSKNAFSAPRNRLWWVCIPLPFSPTSGLGMKVA